MVQLYNDYKEHADFLTVYVREAHPTDEWQMKSNVKEDVCYAQPKTLAQRVAIANDFIKRFNYPIDFGIDDVTDSADHAYSAWPERLYIIDEHGRIAFKFSSVSSRITSSSKANSSKSKTFAPPTPHSRSSSAP